MCVINVEPPWNPPGTPLEPPLFLPRRPLYLCGFSRAGKLRASSTLTAAAVDAVPFSSLPPALPNLCASPTTLTAAADAAPSSPRPPTLLILELLLLLLLILLLVLLQLQLVALPYVVSGHISCQASFNAKTRACCQGDMHPSLRAFFQSCASWDCSSSADMEALTENVWQVVKKR